MTHGSSIRRGLFAGLLGLVMTLGPLGGAVRIGAAEGGVVIFAAASLRNALDEATAAWSRETGKAVRISYAGSNVLAKQIEAGAPADLFVSADLAWMEYVREAGSIRPGTQVDLLRNAIVLIAPRDSGVSIALEPGLSLVDALGGGRLAMGNVEAVPAGRYGKAALVALGAWDGIKDRVAQAENVRAALLLVARGEAPLGIVYSSDAVSEPSVKVIATFPPGSHPPIVYPIARTTGSTDPDATDLLAWLCSAAAKPFFERQGFSVAGSGDAP